MEKPMLNRACIKFEKVSKDQFINDCLKLNPNLFGSMNLSEVYESIPLPKRKTKTSAGYDFALPIDISLFEGEDYTITIPTGIRCKMDDNLVLSLYPRSSYGFKYGMTLANTVGIIDSDYYNAENEGHIMAKVTFKGTDNVTLTPGSGFIQGIFTQFFVSEDDFTNEVRVGGTGSTDNK